MTYDVIYTATRTPAPRLQPGDLPDETQIRAWIDGYYPEETTHHAKRGLTTVTIAHEGYWALGTTTVQGVTVPVLGRHIQYAADNNIYVADTALALPRWENDAWTPDQYPNPIYLLHEVAHQMQAALAAIVGDPYANSFWNPGMDPYKLPVAAGGLGYDKTREARLADEPPDGLGYRNDTVSQSKRWEDLTQAFNEFLCPTYRERYGRRSVDAEDIRNWIIELLGTYTPTFSMPPWVIGGPRDPVEGPVDSAQPPHDHGDQDDRLDALEAELAAMRAHLRATP